MWNAHFPEAQRLRISLLGSREPGMYGFVLPVQSRAKSQTSLYALALFEYALFPFSEPDFRSSRKIPEAF